MDPVADAALAAFVDEVPLHRRPLLRFVGSFARSLEAGTVILDAGAGAAPYRPLFAHCAYRTHDWEESVHPGARTADVVGDLVRGLPLDDGAVDAVLCTEVLEHVDDLDLALAELGRVLAPAGRLAVTVPFVGPLHEEPHDYRRLTNHGLRRALEGAGFRDVSVEPLTGFFSTLAFVLESQSAATLGDRGGARRLFTRVCGSMSLVVARLLARAAPWLDRHLDRAHRLPIGWCALATAPPTRRP